MDTLHGIVEKLGGFEAAGSLAEVQSKTVWAWLNVMRKFPANTYVLFADELRRRGHYRHRRPPPSLWGMKESRPSPRCRVN
jgi:hypothetical protein